MNITKKIIITDTNIIDMVKNDEINSKTGNVNIINNFKTVGRTPEQIKEMFIIPQKEKSLSQYDVMNYIIARDNNAILATGDRRLKKYSEDNNVEVIRTLKIITLMKENNIISQKEAINACNLLKDNSNTRIPKEDIENLLNKLMQ